jgi:hypothetical protein
MATHVELQELKASSEMFEQGFQYFQGLSTSMNSFHELVPSGRESDSLSYSTYPLMQVAL